MNVWSVLLAVATSLSAQVPPPTTAARAAEPLRSERRAILEREATRIEALAARLDRSGEKDGAKAVRKSLPPAPPADGSERFEFLPPFLPARDRAAAAAEKDAPAWRADLETIRTEAAKDLFDLAVRAAGTEPRHYSLADACLRGVVARNRDHAEARRLLGQVAYHGGWATPYAAEQLDARKMLHPVYGWVKASWILPLSEGKLPAATRSADAPERWLPAVTANAQRKDFKRGWQIHTEHFDVQTNVPFAEAIEFGRNLEVLNDVFQSLMADVLGDHSPLAQRYRNPAMVGERPARAHSVWYFATRREYSDAVRVFPQVNAEKSLGYYNIPAPGRDRGRAYFFRDPGGQLDANATLFHEASHMLLFESGAASPEAILTNDGNYWVFEGLGTYFETLAADPDGTIRIGGLNGPRNVLARTRMRDARRFTPLASFVGLDQRGFNKRAELAYMEASALTSYLMHGEEARYRDGFLEYVKDACQGDARAGSGRALDIRLDVSFAKLQAGFLKYLEK